MNEETPKNQEINPEEREDIEDEYLSLVASKQLNSKQIERLEILKKKLESFEPSREFSEDLRDLSAAAELSDNSQRVQKGEPIKPFNLSNFDPEDRKDIGKLQEIFEERSAKNAGAKASTETTVPTPEPQAETPLPVAPIVEETQLVQEPTLVSEPEPEPEPVPEQPIYQEVEQEPKLPKGFENWPQWKKEAFEKGEPNVDGQDFSDILDNSKMKKRPIGPESEAKREKYKKLEIEFLKKSLGILNDDEGENPGKSTDELFEEMSKVSEQMANSTYNHTTNGRSKEYLENRLKKLTAETISPLQTETRVESLPEMDKVTEIEYLKNNVELFATQKKLDEVRKALKDGSAMKEQEKEIQDTLNNLLNKVSETEEKFHIPYHDESSHDEVFFTSKLMELDPTMIQPSVPELVSAPEVPPETAVSSEPVIEPISVPISESLPEIQMESSQEPVSEAEKSPDEEAKEFSEELDSLEHQLTKEKTANAMTEPAISEVSEKNIQPEVQSQPITPVEDTLEWNDSDEWKEFKKLRDELAKDETSDRSTLKLSDKDLRTKYAKEREKVADLLKRQAYENLGIDESSATPEQKSKINDSIFEELVQKENDAYLNALKANREKTWLDKGKIGLAKMAGSRTMQWYLKLPRAQRMAINFTLGTAIGLGLGAAGSIGAVGYTGMRLARAGASFGGSTLGAVIGERKKGWSLEDLDKEEKEKTEALKASDKTLEEKSKELAKISGEYGEKRRKIKLNKAILTIGLGAGAGLLSGLSEHLVGGVGKPSAPEGGANRPDVMPAGHAPTPKLSDIPSAPKPGPEVLTEPTVPEPSLDIEDIKPKPPIDMDQINQMKISKEIFENPENLEHIKIEGNTNSAWKAIEKVFKENEQFNRFNPGQKDNVVSFFTNKLVKNPKEYGFIPDEGFGVKLELNQEISLSKLLNDPDEIKRVLKGAADMTPKEQEYAEELRKQIETYNIAHHNEPLTIDKVSEILATKPKIVENIPEPMQEPILEPTPIRLGPESSGSPSATAKAALGKAEPIPAPVPKTLDENQLNKEIDAYQQRLNELERNIKKPPIIDKKIMAGMAGTAGLAAGVATAGSFGGQKTEGAGNGNLERTFVSDSKKAQEMRVSAQIAKETFENGINETHGKKGMMGFGRVKGIDSKEWKELEGFVAKNLIQYTKKEEREKLPAKFLKIMELPQNQRFLEGLIHVIGEIDKQTGNIIIPREEEHPGEYMLRLIGSLPLETSQLENLQKAA
ncbi:MAG: hypothetical protein V1896_00265 [Candidatus Zambryskibacteria bacterium]